ncbi:complement receptor type 2-like [Diadema antillarum]|uniref:complement receptor type 2-like n=1 Tax=Diadema antillarum TaxID=105358 RepID=UPI003A83C44E
MECENTEKEMKAKVGVRRVGPTSSSSSSAAPSTASCRVSGANPGSTFNEGSHTVQYRATDSAGNYATCTIRFVVVGYYVSGGSSSRTCQQTGNSGVWSGSAPSCARFQFTVDLLELWFLVQLRIVSDVYTTAPSFTHCPTSQSVYAPALATKATVTWSTPTATDNSGETITPVRVQGSPYGSQFSEGVHHVQYRAVDSAGNENTCSFSITVEVIQCSAQSVSTPLRVSCPNGNIRGSVCSFSCVVGYSLQGEGSTECQLQGSTGIWTHGQPSCQILQCPSISLQHGTVVGTCSRNYGTKCQFSCNAGYEINNDELTCTAQAGSTSAHWVGATPVCSRILCTKPPLSTALQMMVTSACPAGNVVPSGNQCQFSCAQGYYLQGNTVLTCNHDRTWSGNPPSCHLITCSSDDLPAPDHGRKVGCSNDREDYGTSCTLACEDGYEPKTPVSKTCSDDSDGDGEGVWTGNNIVCTIVKCPALTPPANGAISQCSFMGVVEPTTSPSQNYSAVCTIACNTGFTMTAGSGQRTCLSTGAWETPPTTCSDITPPVITCPLDVELMAEAGTTSATVHWANITLPQATDRGTAIPTYVFSIDSVQVAGNSLPTSLTEGDHTIVHQSVDSAGNSATCSHNVRVRVIRCPPVQIPDDGSATLTAGQGSCQGGVVFGSTCTIACDSGYQMYPGSGPTVERTCDWSMASDETTGFWTEFNPACYPVNCTVPSVTNGQSSDCTSATVEYRTSCQFSCSAGYTSPSGVVTVTRTCQSDKSWSGSDFQCTGSLFPEGGTVIGYLATDAAGMTTRCDITITVQGYDLIGPSAVSCDLSSDGSPAWEDAPPVCQIQTCPPLLPTNPATVVGCDPSSPVSYRSECTIQCPFGFVGVGEILKRCLADGVWSSTNFTCDHTQSPTFVRCPSEVVVYASRSSDTALVSWNVTAEDNSDLEPTLSCDLQPGVMTRGIYQVKCNARDDAGNENDCSFTVEVKVRHCQSLVPPVHGTIEEACNDTFGAECTVSCSTGYKLVGSRRGSCEFNGTDTFWYFEQDPVCEVMGCSPLPLNQSILVTPTDCALARKVPLGTVCVLHCDPGLVLEGDGQPLTCLTSEEWSRTLDVDSLLCADRTPPTNLSCPSAPIMAVRKEYSGVEVTFDLPSAEDAVDGTNLMVTTEPPDLRTPYTFVSDTVCRFTFTDSSNNSVVCVFHVFVSNEVQPVIEECPPINDSITASQVISIPWESPSYLEIPGVDLTMDCNMPNPARLPWGDHHLLCQVIDPQSGLYAECSRNFSVKPIPCPALRTPTHGSLACDTFAYGKYCSIMCQEEHDIARRGKFKGNSLYVCGNSGRWSPSTYVPDCSAIRNARGFNLPLRIMYYADSCQSGESNALPAIKDQFIDIINGSPFQEICTGNQKCTADNVEVECGQGDSRRRRDAPELAAGTVLYDEKNKTTLTATISLVSNRNVSTLQD